jgi:DNA-binding NarL/FixJ family response regulator
MTMTELDACPVISIVIAEDEPVFRQGLRAEFERFPKHVEIVGEAANAEEAVTLVQELVPDLVLLDLRLPQTRGAFGALSWTHGVAAIKQIVRVAPRTRVLVLSYCEEPEILFAALRAGAHGYIAKGDRYDGADLVDSIQKITAGEVIYGPVIAQLFREYHQHGHESGVLVEPLTVRERDVLDLLASHKSNREIAEELVISVKTVKTHVANILAKLHLESRHEIPLYVRLQGNEREMP